MTQQFLICAREAGMVLPAFQISDGKFLPLDIQWMPPGTHVIKAHDTAGKPLDEMTVIANEAAAKRTNETLRTLLAKAAAGEGDTPYFDLNHDDAEASFHPTEFFWAGDDLKTGGIRAKGEWTEAGTRAVLGKNFRRFSPLFYATERGEVMGAPLNMGGLVNRAAFKKIGAFFAKGALDETADQTLLIRARAVADCRNISDQDALLAVCAAEPALYEAYRAQAMPDSSFKPAERTALIQARESSPYYLKAEKIAEGKGISVNDALLELSKTPEGNALYEQTRNG